MYCYYWFKYRAKWHFKKPYYLKTLSSHSSLPNFRFHFHMNIVVVFSEIYSVDTGSLCMFPSFSAKSFTKIINVNNAKLQRHRKNLQLLFKVSNSLQWKGLLYTMKMIFSTSITYFKVFSTFFPWTFDALSLKMFVYTPKVYLGVLGSIIFLLCSFLLFFSFKGYYRTKTSVKLSIFWSD